MAQRISDVPDQYSPRVWKQIMRDLISRLAKLEATVGPYTVTNFTETRTLDPTIATTADVANFIATLVNDMQNAGRFSSP